MTGACDSEVQKTVEISHVQHTYRIVDSPVVTQRQVPTIQTVQNTVEVPMRHHLDRVVDVLVVVQRQRSMIQKVARTAEIPHVPFVDRIVFVLVMMQRQVPTIKRVQSIMSSTQVQLIGFDTAIATPYWKVKDARSADRSGAEFNQVTPWHKRLSCSL